MGWWEKFSTETAENVGKNLKTFFTQLDQVDADLKAEKGIGSAILRGIFKAITVIFKAPILLGASLFPGPVADPKVLFAVNTATVTQESWDATIDVLVRTFGLSDSQKDTLKSLGVSLEGTSPVVRGLCNVLMFVAITQFLAGPALGAVGQSMFSKFRPNAPAPGEVMGARALDPGLDKRIWDILARNGVADKDIEVMFAATYQRVPEEIVRAIYYRHDKSPEWVEHRLSELGYTPERIAEITSVWEVIPGIQDLVMMMGREAFEPDMIKRYGLDELYPGELTGWAAKQGMKEEWARKYWYAHWTHPGMMQVFEMYHRDQLTEDEMWSYFGLVEIPPFWRQKLMNISYNVITRVDARRMWEVGVIKEEKTLHDLYRHMGYSPDDATLMVDWTKHYAASADRDLTRADILAAYLDGDMNAQEAVDYMKRIGYPEDYATFLVYRSDQEEARDARNDKLTLVQDRYVGNLISEAEARNQLVGLGFTNTKIAGLLDKWSYLRQKNTKMPSKTDLDKLLRATVIGVGQYTDQMYLLGYSEKYINWYLQLIKVGKET